MSIGMLDNRSLRRGFAVGLRAVAALAVAMSGPAFAAEPTATSLAASPNPSVFGQEVTLKAAVESPAGLPTGQVQFYGSGTELLGTATLAGAPFTMVAAGDSHSCALTSGGAVQCWGLNGAGQIGDGTRGTNRPTPVTVIASGAISVAAGGGHSCAVVDDGAVQCWGDNIAGQIGDGTTTQRLTPVEVIASGATAIAAGNRHSCAVTTGGAVQCWGYNAWGQIGDGPRLFAGPRRR